MEAHGDELLGDARCGRLVRTGAVDHCLALVLPAVLALLERLERHRSWDHAIPGATCARSRIDDDERASCGTQRRELLDRDAAHAQLLEELVAPPPLQPEK